MATITWYNKTAATPVEWVFSLSHQRPSTGPLQPGKQHTEQRIDRCQPGVRCLAFSGVVAIDESDSRDIDVIISE